MIRPVTYKLVCNICGERLQDSKGADWHNISSAINYAIKKGWTVKSTEKTFCPQCALRLKNRQDTDNLPTVNEKDLWQGWHNIKLHKNS